MPVQLLLLSASSSFSSHCPADGQCTDNQVMWLTRPVVLKLQAQLRAQTQTSTENHDKSFCSTGDIAAKKKLTTKTSPILTLPESHRESQNWAVSAERWSVSQLVFSSPRSHSLHGRSNTLTHGWSTAAKHYLTGQTTSKMENMCIIFTSDKAGMCVSLPCGGTTLFTHSSCKWCSDNTKLNTKRSLFWGFR